MSKPKVVTRTVKIVKGYYNVFVFGPEGNEMLKVAANDDNIEELNEIIEKTLPKLGKTS
jgi:hypothetical protein